SDRISTPAFYSLVTLSDRLAAATIVSVVTVSKGAMHAPACRIILNAGVSASTEQECRHGRFPFLQAVLEGWRRSYFRRECRPGGLHPRKRSDGALTYWYRSRSSTLLQAGCAACLPA